MDTVGNQHCLLNYYSEWKDSQDFQNCPLYRGCPASVKWGSTVLATVQLETGIYGTHVLSKISAASCLQWFMGHFKQAQMFIMATIYTIVMPAHHVSMATIQYFFPVGCCCINRKAVCYYIHNLKSACRHLIPLNASVFIKVKAKVLKQ